MEITKLFWEFVTLVMTMDYDDLSQTDHFKFMFALADANQYMEIHESTLVPFNALSPEIKHKITYNPLTGCYMFSDLNDLFYGVHAICPEKIGRCMKKMFNTIDIIEMSDSLSAVQLVY